MKDLVRSSAFCSAAVFGGKILFQNEDSIPPKTVAITDHMLAYRLTGWYRCGCDGCYGGRVTRGNYATRHLDDLQGSLSGL